MPEPGPPGNSPLIGQRAGLLLSLNWTGDILLKMSQEPYTAYRVQQVHVLPL
jgi:hypothetical protein